MSLLPPPSMNRSRRLVGWAMDETIPAGLVSDALRRAAELRGGGITGVILHSDRGSQYLSAEYRQLCDKLGVRQSAGRVATCFDNSAAGSFWSSLKRELVHRYRFATRDRGHGRHQRVDPALLQRQASLDPRIRAADRVGTPLPSHPTASCITKCPAGGGKFRIRDACNARLITQRFVC